VNEAVDEVVAISAVVAFDVLPLSVDDDRMIRLGQDFVAVGIVGAEHEVAPMGRVLGVGRAKIIDLPPGFATGVGRGPGVVVYDLRDHALAIGNDQHGQEADHPSQADGAESDHPAGAE
jgi:hypothetical protein